MKAEYTEEDIALAVGYGIGVMQGQYSLPEISKDQAEIILQHAIAHVKKERAKK